MTGVAFSSQAKAKGLPQASTQIRFTHAAVVPEALDFQSDFRSPNIFFAPDISVNLPFDLRHAIM